MRLITFLFEGSDGQKHMILEDISKYFISFGMMMTFTIFNINKHFLYNHIEKSRVLFFNEILSNKHASPPIFKFPKQSVRCGIVQKRTLRNFCGPAITFFAYWSLFDTAFFPFPLFYKSNAQKRGLVKTSFSWQLKRKIRNRLRENRPQTVFFSSFWPRAMLKGPKRSFVVVFVLVVVVLGGKSWAKNVTK